jgi:filamentous hemagglutinin family protein
MTGKQTSPLAAAWRRWRQGRMLTRLALAVALGTGNVQGGDLLRKGAVAVTPTDSTATGGSGTTGTTTSPVLGGTDRLARTTQALAAVQQMQNAARNLAIAGSNSLRAGLPSVPVNSYQQTNGLNVAAGSNKLWVGANQPVQTTQTTGATTTSNVTVTQTQQQALLTWDSFNIGKNTTLTFDQSAGGTNVGQWIAFNYVRDPTGNPTQILGTIKTIGAPDSSGNATVGGQVYVMNSNGIIFGGSSQVNAHGLTASSLPINYNLIQSGLLNNPDAQFLFSALPLPAGTKGPTPAFDPSVAASGVAPVQTPLTSDGTYGDVVVQPGATLTAPTSADHVGGRIALVGPNVTNAGTLSTADGQTILAAGLQVGMAPHDANDPTLRGLDVFVGEVADSSLPNQPAAGTATNAGLDTAGLGVDASGFNTSTTNPGALNVLGWIDAPRADVYLTGQAVVQSGVITSSTSVAYDGRVDLVAAFNATPNPLLGQGTGQIAQLPFIFASFVGNRVTGALITNTGPVTMGRDSVLQILPEDSTDRVVGDLALPSLVNLQGQSVYFGPQATLLAPGAAVPRATSDPLNPKPALAVDGSSLQAGVTIQAGGWAFDQFGQAGYTFVHTADNQQIYFDQNARIDVAGMADVSASVAENIISVELRGSELAGSPLQRDSALRGQTVQVDVRQHGPWDPTLNDGLGGYTWVGTPLADTSGWVGLTTHSAQELMVDGGSVSLKAGGAVVLQTSATIDVSGGSIDYQGGNVATTKVVSGGHVYDIAQATPDRVYDGIYNATTTTTDPKWGTTTTSVNPLAHSVYESGYVQGGNGGSLSISSPVVALDGTLLGNTVAGPLQRTFFPTYNPASPPAASSPVQTGEPAWLLSATSLPLYGQLSLTLQRQVFDDDASIENFQDISPTPPNIVFKAGSTLAASHPAGAFNESGNYTFAADRNNEIDLAPALVSNDTASNPAAGGFGILRVDNSGDNLGSSPGLGNITIKSGTQIVLPAGGSLTLLAGNITVEPGQIQSTTSAATNTLVSAPGGSISLAAYDISSSLAELVTFYANGLVEELPDNLVPRYNPDRGNITIGSGAVLEVAGNLVDERASTTDSGNAPLVSAGGSIALNGNNVTLDGQTGTLAPSELNVSGAGVISATGKLTYANAGSITLDAGRALGTGFGAVVGGQLTFAGANLEGYAGLGKKGGSLNLQAPSVAIMNQANGAAVQTDASTGALTLAPGFFNDGGFASFFVTGLGVAVGIDGNPGGAAPAFTVIAQTLVDPQVQNWVSQPGGAVYTAQTGLQTPASLKFKASDELTDVFGVYLENNTALVLNGGAEILTAPGGSVTLGGATVDVLGQVVAQGGQITVTATGNDEAVKYATSSLPTLHLGTQGSLDVSGAATDGTGVTGYHKTDVLDGGTITLDGNIVAEKGAVLNVSGADDTVEVSAGQLPASVSSGSALNLVPTEKQSNGGTLTLIGEKVLLTEATLLGGPGLAADGTTVAQGGDLVISSHRATTGYDNNNGTLLNADDIVLTLAAQTTAFNYTGLGKTLTNGSGMALGDAKGLGQLWFGADSLTGSGFGSLTLAMNGKGALQVQGNVAVSTSRQITLADGGVVIFGADPAAPAVAPSLTLAAPYVVLGRQFLGPQTSGEESNPFAPSVVSATHGAGSLTVNAGALIDVGDFVLQNAGVATLDATYSGKSGATAGAIRGDGTLDIAGSLTLKAGQVYPPTATTFNLIAADYTVNGTTMPGSVTLQSSGQSTLPSVPLSAGGTLNVYASVINQGGVLRAPLGVITLGVGSAGGTDPFSGAQLPVTSSLILQAGSLTSVSAGTLTIPYGINVNGDTWIDPTGQDISAPLGKAIVLNGSSINIQAAGADALGNSQSAAQIDLSGGGDLYAYRFVPGTGGKVDVLAPDSAAFAVIPGYADAYAPYASYDSSTNAQAALGADAGYTIAGNAGFKSTLHVGDKVHLEAGGGLPAGDYTILPARYALLPGAFLITPQSTALTAGAALSVAQPVGSTIVAGYRYSGLNSTGRVQALYGAFEVAPQSVVLQRAEYDGSQANTFFAGLAVDNNTAIPRLPVDAGQLVVAAGSALKLQGKVAAEGGTGGRGGLIDISSSADIFIGSQASIAALGTNNTIGEIVLDAAELNGFGAESLLIGGVRQSGTDGTTVTVNTNNVTVDNAGEALGGSDLILVANQNLVLKSGAEIGMANQPAITADALTVVGSQQLTHLGDSLTVSHGGTPIGLPSGTPGNGLLTATSDGTITAADGSTTRFTATTGGATNAFSVPVGGTVTLDHAGTLALASSTDPVVKTVPLVLGDGALLRVGSDPAAQITRSGVAGTTSPTLTVGSGAKIIGARAILDSTNVTNLDSSATFAAGSLSLDSGRISVLLNQPGTVATTGSLVLGGSALQSLQASTSSLSLLSYSTLDLYGTGTLGSATLASLALHAGAIRGYTNSTDPSATVTVAAKSVQLDNGGSGFAPTVAGPVSGALVVKADTLTLGAGQLAVENYAGVTVDATGGVMAKDTGGLTVTGGDLTFNTPLITGAAGALQSIATDGRLSLQSVSGTATITPGLGASLSLTGAAVDSATMIQLPSGSLTVVATTGDLSVTGGALDVSGTARHFFDVNKYTNGGQISLMADAGDLTIGSDAKISVAADADGGSAGTLAVAAPVGTFSIAEGVVNGTAGAGGLGGNFSLDARTIPGTDSSASHLAALGQALADGGFDRTVNLHVRQGNVVADGTIRAHDFTLSADQGSITVMGTLDASGLDGSTQSNPLGGTINAADPTGGSIDLSAAGNLVLAPGSWLTAAGYAYNNAGKGGAISLSAGSYVNHGGSGQADTTAIVDIQAGSQIDLGVQNAFTAEDLTLSGGVTPAPSMRTDLFTGTLHVRETQVAFGSGAQFSSLGSSVHGASGIVLEGYQEFDLTGTTGTTSTTGAITSIGSGGLIDATVEAAVKASGTAFLGAINPALLGNALFHVQPGAEIINRAPDDGTVTAKFFTLYSKTTGAISSISFTLAPGAGIFTPVLIPGGMPTGISLKTTAGRQFTLTMADGTVTGLITANASTTISSASSTNPVVAVNFRNSGSSPLATQLSLNNSSAGSTPVTLALNPTVPITATAFVGSYAAYSGDLTLANTWDLSAYRFGPNNEPGNLTLRSSRNLVLGFDASLNDGFDPANPVDVNNPIWTAQLQSSRSWSYRLVAGADYGAANSRSVQPLPASGTDAGSVLIGSGSPALPTATGTSVTRTVVIPRFFQTVRTGTGDIGIFASNDVQLLDPLATIYTAGRTAPAITGFDLPVLNLGSFGSSTASTPYYPAQYSLQGGDVTIDAGHDIARYTLNPLGQLVPDSSKELPSNWLYRRGTIGADGNYAAVALSATRNTEIQSTSWWIDFSNFFSDVGALGGGQVSLVAGNSVANVDASVPTNARMPYKDATGATITPSSANLIEQGGGNLLVKAGANIDGGVYYVERGDAILQAGDDITTNATRAPLSGSTNIVEWLPTTFFLGKGTIDLSAGGDIRLGAVADAFLLPQGAGNRTYEKSFFSTFDPRSSVTATSLAGTITVQDQTDGGIGDLIGWYQNVLFNDARSTPAASEPWLRVVENNFSGFTTVTALFPGTLRLTAFTGDIDLVGRLVLSPSPTGTLDLLAAGNVNGVQPNAVSGDTLQWGSAAVDLSDADPLRVPGIVTPVSFATYTLQSTAGNTAIALAPVDALFAETGATNLTLEQKLALHGQTTDAQGQLVALHYDDTDPAHIYAIGGDVSGLTFYAGKQTRVVATQDVTDVALYMQNLKGGDVSVVAAGGNLIAYDPASPLRLAAQASGNSLPGGTPGAVGTASGAANTGDLQIAGPGMLEVLAGTNLVLGSGNLLTTDGTAAGITSVGSARNPHLPQNSGASIIASAGVGSVYTPAAAAAGVSPGLATTNLEFPTFIADFLDPSTAGTEATRYLPVLGGLMGLAATDTAAIWATFDFKPNQPLTEKQAALVISLFNVILRDSARDRNDPDSPDFGTYKNGFAAITALFPGSPIPDKEALASTVPVVRPAGPWVGKFTLSTREVKTFEGGDISLLAPGGEITVGRATDPQKPDQGILTERGGGISIFAADSVNVGTSRIFTLRGGDEIIWSTWGNIAAGSGSKTVFSAPPTRVLIDPQSGDVQNDLAGLATGSGIGVLATLAGVKPGDVDLIAPVGTIDAGDAGIRSSGNLNLAARVVLNASNIQVGGSSTGVPPPPPTPNLGSLTAASSASAAASSAATDVAKQGSASSQAAELPSLISVEVLGYGGGEGDEPEAAGDSDTDKDPQKKKAGAP